MAFANTAYIVIAAGGSKIDNDVLQLWLTFSHPGRTRPPPGASSLPPSSSCGSWLDISVYLW